MRLIDFIFALVFKFVPVKEEDLTRLKGEIQADWNDVQTDPTNPMYKAGIKATVKKFTEGAWTRLGMAIGYIFAVRLIQDFMNPKEEEEETKRIYNE